MLLKRASVLSLGVIFVLIGLTATTLPACSQSLVDLNTADQAQLEEEKAQAAVPLNEDIVQQMVQNAQPVGKGLQDDSKYTLGANDVVEISVMRHPEVSGQFPINSEGKIQYNFVGDIVISGQTKDEAAKIISNRLAEYIINPEVTVKIVGYNSKVIYVFGEVGAPGKVFMRGDTITVREALVQAGLPQLTGILKKSWLITPSETGKVDKKLLDVYALMYEGDLRQDLVMKPGDVIYVPATTMTKVLRAVTPVTAPISNVRSVTPY